MLTRSQFLESFAKKHISSSEDRLEETKRRKLALKAEKLVELMMVSGIPTASGYEERIRFSEMEMVDRGASEQGLVVNLPEGQAINGWDVNVAGVRTITVKKHVRKSFHAEFVVRVKEKDKAERYVGRRYGDFVKLHKRLRTEIPGKVLPPPPKKNRTHTAHIFGGGGDDEDSESSASSKSASAAPRDSEDGAGGGLRAHVGLGSQKHNASSTSVASSLHVKNSSPARRSSPGMAPGDQGERIVLYREEQRVSLRAFLRTLLQNERIARSDAMREFLTSHPLELKRDELEDVARRKDMDNKRIQEQRKFYEVARRRAKELDEHMEKFRRDIVESSESFMVDC